MRIIEGKQAVLRSYRTERECVLPKRGQTVLPLEPVACPMRDPSTAACSPVTVSDGNICRPAAHEFREVSDANIRRPVAYESREISDADMHRPVERSMQEIPDVVMRSATESVSHIDDIIINKLQTTEAQVIPATPELEQIMGGTEARMPRMKKRKWFADKILHITNSR